MALPSGERRAPGAAAASSATSSASARRFYEHAKEFASSGFDATAKEVVPEAPVVFSKPPSAVIGPAAPIPSYLDPTDSVDYEANSPS